jgi:hypothetical protein
MGSNEKAIEAEIQSKGLNAPRLTPDMIDSQIMSEMYWTPEGTTLTVCVLTLRNGFTVTGESAAASAENFDIEIGKKIARENARIKIWPLEGYLLRNMLYETACLNPNRSDRSSVTNAMNAAASLAHEVNRIWCRMNGDFSQPSWADAPDWQRNSALNGVAFHMDNPDAGDSASHDSWMAEKVADGWVYGEVKDPDAKTHPCIVPFEQLPEHQQIKDSLFRSIVHSVIGSDF